MREIRPSRIATMASPRALRLAPMRSPPLSKMSCNSSTRVPREPDQRLAAFLDHPGEAVGLFVEALRRRRDALAQGDDHVFFFASPALLDDLAEHFGGAVEQGWERGSPLDAVAEIGDRWLRRGSPAACRHPVSGHASVSASARVLSSSSAPSVSVPFRRSPAQSLLRVHRTDRRFLVDAWLGGGGGAEQVLPAPRCGSPGYRRLLRGGQARWFPSLSTAAIPAPA